MSCGAQSDVEMLEEEARSNARQSVSDYGPVIRSTLDRTIKLQKVVITLLVVFLVGAVLETALIHYVTSKQTVALDYREFIGEYKSESRSVRDKIQDLEDELATERAWKSSIKRDLGELLGVLEDQRLSEVVRRMVDEDRPTKENSSADQ